MASVFPNLGIQPSDLSLVDTNRDMDYYKCMDIYGKELNISDRRFAVSKDW